MFIPEKWIRSACEPWELQPATNGLALKVGTALVLTGGKLVKATGEVKPAFISMSEATVSEDGQQVPVERVREETIYETQLSVTSSAIAVGNKYTIDAAGEKITATATNGHAEVVSFLGKAAGDKVYVRFV